MKKNEPATGDIYIFPEWDTALGVVCPIGKGEYTIEAEDNDCPYYLFFTDGWSNIPGDDEEYLFVRVENHEIEMYKMVYPGVNWEDLEKLRGEALGCR